MKQFFKFMFASCLGSFISMIVVLVVIFSMIGAMVASSSKTEEVKDNSVLVIDLSKPIYDREVTDISNMVSSLQEGINDNNSIGLTELLATINRAKNDDNIKAIMLNVSNFQANGISTAEEIREGLLDFKKSGKKIYAYSDMCDQKSYYVASVADKIQLNPAGMVTLSGLGGEIMFIKDLIDKFKVDVTLIRPKNNAYKSAGEMFIMDKMSEANKEQTREYLSSIWSVISPQIAESRHIDINTFNNLVSSLQGFLPDDAVKNKIVDNLGFKTDFEDTIQKYTNIQYKQDKDKKVHFIKYSSYREAMGDVYQMKDKNIAIVYAYGDVSQGKGSDLSIGSETIVKALRKAADNDKVKAIVFRVNSPGGDGIASELITNEVIRAKRKKLVIVSMGDMAASAGYEMSSNASYIVASRTTLTGSIGVFGVMPNFNRALKEQLGITFDTIKTHKNSNPLSVTVPMTNDAMMMMQRNVEVFYSRFVNRVATGRGKTPAYINTIARGRVWTGLDAKGLGLIDEFGGLERAIQVAAQKANLQSYGIIEYPKVKGIMGQLISSMDEDSKMKSLTKELGRPYSFFYTLRNISNMQGVQMRLPYIIEF
jgi:protease IV